MRTVLGDDAIEELGMREDLEEVFELTAGDEHDPPSRFPQPLQRADRVVVHDTVRRDRSVVIGRQHLITHISPQLAPSESYEDTVQASG